MSVFWLTFRLHEQTTSRGSYEERYDALMAELQAFSTLTWTNTTSFVVFESASSIAALGQAFKGVIDPKVDLFLMRAMESKLAVICGSNDDPGIYRLMLRDNGATYLTAI
jgi:hypothetical protein